MNDLKSSEKAARSVLLTSGLTEVEFQRSLDTDPECRAQFEALATGIEAAIGCDKSRDILVRIVSCFTHGEHPELDAAILEARQFLNEG